MKTRSQTQIVAICFLAIPVSMHSAHSAAAGVIYDNLGMSSNRWIYGETNDLLAQPFVLDSGTIVASATLQLVRYHTSVSGTLDVQIWEDNGAGFPGNPVGTLGTIPGDLGLGHFDYYVPAYITRTFDDPVTGLSPGALYHLVLSFRNATTLGAQSQVGWTMVQPSTGTNGAGEALALGEVSGAQWVNISSFVQDERYNYFQTSLTTAPEPSSDDSVLLGTSGAFSGHTISIGAAGQWAAQAFTLFEPVNVDAINMWFAGSASGPVLMQLTNSLGPGTTTSNVLAAATIEPATTPSSLFPGIMTSVPVDLVLQPGDYFIVLSVDPQNAQAGWVGHSPVAPTPVGRIGRALWNDSSMRQDSFPPASDWVACNPCSQPGLPAHQWAFQIIGSTAAVPEPTTLSLFVIVAMGLALLGLTGRQRKAIATSHV